MGLMGVTATITAITTVMKWSGNDGEVLITVFLRSLRIVWG